MFPKDQVQRVDIIFPSSGDFEQSLTELDDIVSEHLAEKQQKQLEEQQAKWGWMAPSDPVADMAQGNFAVFMRDPSWRSVRVLHNNNTWESVGFRSLSLSLSLSLFLFE